MLARLFGEEKGSPMARGSILYDCLNYIVVDGHIEPLAVDERTLAKRHLDSLAEIKTDKEIILFDRGYPSERMIDYCEEHGFFYIMRVRGKFNLDVDNQESNDGFVQIGKNKVRVIKVVLDTGEVETLLTNLIGNFDFKELYFIRWGIEIKFDVLKNTLELENFSGRSETAIRQDFYIHIIASNMLAASFWEAQEIADKQRNNGDNKHEYKINMAQAASAIRDYLPIAILTDDPLRQTMLLKKMTAIIASAVIPIRPNRKVPRKPNNRKSKFHHNRKPNL